MIDYFFHWFDGAIWGNLLASILWALPAFIWGRKHVKKVHQHLSDQDAKVSLTHKHIREIHSHLGVSDGSQH